MSSKKITVIDLTSFVLYAILGGFLFYMWDALFQDITLCHLTLVLIPIHFIVGIVCVAFCFTKKNGQNINSKSSNSL